MEDLTGGASAPADTAAASNSEPVPPPNPITTDPKPAEAKKPDEGKEEAQKPISTREALKKAADKMAERAKAESQRPEKKLDAIQTAVKKDATEKPAPKQQADEKPEIKAETPPVASQHRDAPSRFSNDAKAAWETSPEPVKAEVHRAIRELEQGYEKHRTDAEAFNEVREYDELAKSVGTTMKAAMTNYVGIERLLAQNPIAGFQRIAQNMGLDLHQIAAAIVGQSPDQVRVHQDTTIAELRKQITELQQAVSGTSTYIKDQRENAVLDEINAFAADPEHARFEELSDDIAFFLQTKKAKNLGEAYDLAVRLNPAPVASPAPDLSAQTRKGTKSVSGAPSAGSDPATRKPSTSIKDSLRRAASQAG